MAIVKAEAVFNPEAGFSEEELARIGAAAAGRTVSFRRTGDAGTRRRGDAEKMLEEFARGKTGDELAGKHGMSRRQVFYALKAERIQGFKDSRIREWREKGLSWREVGRLFGVSHETVRKMAGEQEEETEGKSQKPKAKSQNEETGTDSRELTADG